MPGLDLGFAQPVLQAGLRNPEILSNLLDRYPILTALGNRHDIIAELSWISLRHVRHPSSGTPQHHKSDVTYACSRPIGYQTWFRAGTDKSPTEITGCSRPDFGGYDKKGRPVDKKGKPLKNPYDFKYFSWELGDLDMQLKGVNVSTVS
jgi:hypothetical protein